MFTNTFSSLHFLRSANISHSVSKYRDDIEEKIGKPVTILVAFNCIFESVCFNKSQKKLNV